MTRVPILYVSYAPIKVTDTAFVEHRMIESVCRWISSEAPAHGISCKEVDFDNSLFISYTMRNAGAKQRHFLHYFLRSEISAPVFLFCNSLSDIAEIVTNASRIVDALFSGGDVKSIYVVDSDLCCFDPQSWSKLNLAINTDYARSPKSTNTLKGSFYFSPEMRDLALSLSYLEPPLTTSTIERYSDIRWNTLQHHSRDEYKRFQLPPVPPNERIRSELTQEEISDVQSKWSSIYDDFASANEVELVVMPAIIEQLKDRLGM